MGDECTSLYKYPSSTPACATPLLPPLATKVDIAVSNISPISPNLNDQCILLYVWRSGGQEMKATRGWGGYREKGGRGGRGERLEEWGEYYLSLQPTSQTLILVPTACLPAAPRPYFCTLWLSNSCFPLHYFPPRNTPRSF